MSNAADKAFATTGLEGAGVKAVFAAGFDAGVAARPERDETRIAKLKKQIAGAKFASERLQLLDLLDLVISKTTPLDEVEETDRPSREELLHFGIDA